MTFLPQQSRFHVRKRITWFLAGVAILGGRIVNTPPEIKLFLKVKISLEIEVAKNQDFRPEFMYKKWKNIEENWQRILESFVLICVAPLLHQFIVFLQAVLIFAYRTVMRNVFLHINQITTRKYNVHNNYLIRVCTVRDLFLIYYIKLHII